MRKPITYEQLERFLLDVGFVAVPTTGKHKVFEHESSGAIILLPLAVPNEPVDPLHLAAVRSTVVGMGVLDGKEPEALFDELLERV